jgi:hypothetical protein
MSKEELLFPSFNYYLDESDPDIVILHRQDGTFVAAFSTQGATKEGIGDENPRRQHWHRVIREWRGGGGSRKVSGRFSCLRSSSKNPASSSQVRTLTEAKCPRRPFVQAKVTRHRS